MISYDDFKKVEIRAGKILSAEKVDNADKLLKLSVDFDEKVEVVETSTVIPSSAPLADSTVAAIGNVAPVKVLQPKIRQIVSGIALYFPDPAVLVGKTCMFVTNLEPRTIRGLESQGMLFALSTPPTEANPMGSFSLLEPNSSIPAGTCAK